MKNKGVEKINIENEEEYIKWCKNLKIKSIGNQYISLINEHNTEIEKREITKKEKYKADLPFYLQYRLKYEKYPMNKTVLNIDVCDKQRTRAYIFMNYFIETVQALEGYVKVETRDNDNTVIWFPHCTFECSLTEKRCKYRDVKPAGLKTMRPLYDLVYTGKLVFKIYTVDENDKILNEFVYDEEKVMLEEQIGDIFINLRNILLEISQRNIEAEHIREEESEEKIRQLEMKWEKEREEEERKKQHELRVKQQGVIEDHIKKWKYIKEIQAYVADIRVNAENQPDNIKESMKRYCDYVEELFDRNSFFKDVVKFVRNFQENEKCGG
jgi:hypothetical protein